MYREEPVQHNFDSYLRIYHFIRINGLLTDTFNCGLPMRRECRERFPRHRLQRKLLVSDPGMHHGTCVTHVLWCMSGSVARGGGGNRSRHSQRMRNTQFYVSGKWPMEKNYRWHQSMDATSDTNRNCQCVFGDMECVYDDKALIKMTDDILEEFAIWKLI